MGNVDGLEQSRTNLYGLAGRHRALASTNERECYPSALQTLTRVDTNSSQSWGVALRVARIKQPQLPAGALNDFFAALHDLHLQAGYPSTREIQKDVGRQFVSHTTIHKAFSGPRLPGWIIVEQLVEALADRSRQDRDVVIERFKSLWQVAAKSLQDNSEVDANKVRLATQAVRETIRHRPARPFAELMIGTLDEIEAAGTRQVSRELVPTGFSDVDALTGGMRAGSLIAIASRPSVGKSMLLTTMCSTSALKYGLPTAIFSFEMTEREIQMRILSAQSRVPHHSLRSGLMTDDDWTRLAKRMSEVAEAPLWLSYSASPNLMNLENEAKALNDEAQLRLLAIDSVDALMASEQRSDQTLYRLKQLGADLGVPILITAGMQSRANAGSLMRAEITDLRNADSIEAIADLLVLLDRPDAYDFESPRAGEIDLRFMKNRYGPTATVTLAFQGHYCRMVDMFISDERQPDWSFKTDKDSAGSNGNEED